MTFTQDGLPRGASTLHGWTDVLNALRMRHSGGKFGDRLHDRDVVELLQRPPLA